MAESPYIRVGREMYADLKAHRVELMRENGALRARIAELEGALRELGDRAHLALCNPRQDFMSVVLNEVRATARAIGEGGSDE